MSARNYSSTSRPLSIAAVDAVVTGLTWTGSPAGWPATPFTAAIERSTPANTELVLVTAMTTDAGGASGTMTVTRGYNGTTAKVHGGSASLEHVTAAVDFTQMVGNVGGDTIQSSAPAVKGLVVRAAAAQSVNLQDWQDSSGNILARVESSGQVTALQRIATSYGLAVIPQSANSAAALHVRNGAGGTASIAEFANSAGSILAAVSASGWLNAPVVNVGAAANDGSVALFSMPTSASQKGVLIRGAASQSVNLQEWQNSSGAVLAFIDNGGTIVGQVNGVKAGGNLGQAYLESVIGSPAVKGFVVRGAASQTGNLAEFQDSSGALVAGFGSTGIQIFSGLNTISSATAGGASPLPGAPATYLLIKNSSGIGYRIPLYNP